MQRTLGGGRFYNSLFLFCGSFIIAAASFSAFYVKWHFREAAIHRGSLALSFERMVDGTADRPFVYRQLLPMVANYIDGRVSERFKDHLLEQSYYYGIIRTRVLDSPITQDRKYFLRFAIVYLLDFLFAWAALIPIFGLCRIFGNSSATAALASSVFFLMMPFFETIGGFFYDYPELFFFTLAAWMALKLDWWFMIPLTAVATWNKESFLLFIPALYPLLRQRASRLRAFIGIGVLAITSATVYFLLRLRFKSNPVRTPA